MEGLSTSFSVKPPAAFEYSLPILDLGLRDYPEIHQKQLELISSIGLNNKEEVIIITEHFPVYTCGRTTKPHDRPIHSSIPVVDIERGGELTYHGPGQIVGYPLLNLNKRRLSIPQYLRRLEQALIEALGENGVEARYREECRAGVWVEEKKIASIGIALRRWITFHGFALNVDCDLDPFKNAKPCGFSGDRVTSLQELGYPIPKEKIKDSVIKCLVKKFF